MPPRPYSDRSVLPRDSSNSSASIDLDTAQITVDTSPSTLSAATTPSPVEQDIVMDFNSMTPDAQDEELDFEPSTAAFYPAPGDSMPFDHAFPDFIRQLTNERDLTNVHSLRLKVISRLVSLQRMSLFTTNLRELDLEGSILGSLRDIGCHLKHLQVLKVGNCQLDSLDGTFGLTSLRQLFAQRNLITDVSPCSNLPHIQHIDVSHNRIRNIAYAGFLSVCRKLKTIVFAGNPATQLPDYRNYVKKILPQLQSLDDTSFTNQENEESNPLIEKGEVEDEVNELTGENQTEFYNNSFDSDGGDSATGRSKISDFGPRVLSGPESSDCEVHATPNENLHGREFSLLSLRKERGESRMGSIKGINVDSEETEDLIENTFFTSSQAGRSDEGLTLPPLNVNEREPKKPLQESCSMAVPGRNEKLKFKFTDRSSSVSSDACSTHGSDSKEAKPRPLKKLDRPSTASSSFLNNNETIEKRDNSPKRRPYTAGSEEVQHASGDADSTFKAPAGSLTSGLPICGSLAVALRSRKKQQEREDTDIFKQSELEL